MTIKYLIDGLYGLALSADARGATVESTHLRECAAALRELNGNAKLFEALLLHSLQQDARELGTFKQEELH